MDWKRRAFCGDLTPGRSGEKVMLMGWVDAIRDHGNLLFIHLRDITGIVQVVFDPGVDPESCDKAAGLKEEYVVRVQGKVAVRAPGTENPHINTGTLEVYADDLEVLSKSRPLPFPLSEKAMVFGEELRTGPEKVDEELRLRYRYLDLRRPSMQNLLVSRYRILKCIREYLDSLNFIEVETPFLTRSTPEGARDYLVPSRIHRGKFYALPQSPQLFKQILMMSGFDRYYQIVRCFRDEDLRPNRQPEFTQLDMEMSFIDEEFIYEVIEELISRIFALGGIALPRGFPRMTYREAMERYGTDRPDLRFGMAFEEITDVVCRTEYTVFCNIVEKGGIIKGFCVKGGAGHLSKNVLQNEYAMKIAPALGAGGMTWMKVAGGELQSNIVQFFSPQEQKGIIERFRAEQGDVIMLIADTSRDLVNKVLCDLRLHVAARLDLIPQDLYCPLWVTDFPLFELKDDKLGSQHHPFTMPGRTDFDPKDLGQLLGLNSRAYDLVVNGEELGGGSIRIHEMETQRKIFQALGLTPEQVEAKFGFFLRALEYGAPPHGGLALGMDRVIAMILKTPSIRDVIAFPKNRSAFCPMTRAPSDADPSQLEELGLIPGGPSDMPPAKAAAGETPESPAQAAGENITIDEVKHVARLARLRVTDEEAAGYRNELNAVLDHFVTLQALDTRDVEPMSHVLQIKNVWREDEPRRSERTRDLLENAPEREAGYFKVPKILES